MNNRESLFHNIMLFDFAAQESALFLDTHPNDANAFSYYQEATNRLQQAKNAYESEYGPLTNKRSFGNSYSYYTEAPWPWEGGNTCGSTRNDYNFQ